MHTFLYELAVWSGKVHVALTMREGARQVSILGRYVLLRV